MTGQHRAPRRRLRWRILVPLAATILLATAALATVRATWVGHADAADMCTVAVTR